MKITVVGSGAWGTALALLLLENGNDVTLWSYHQEESDRMRDTHENPMLKGVPLPEELKLTTDLSVVKGCGLVVLATPSFAIRATAARLRELVDPGTIVVSVSKGIEKDTSLRLSQVIEEELQGRCPVVVLSGPSHAEEVGRRIPTGVVAAADELSVAQKVQDLFMNPRFRVYTSDDKVGTDLRRPEKRHRPVCRLLRRDGLRGQHQGPAYDEGTGGDGPAGRGPGGQKGDLHRPGRRGRPHRHLYLHALQEPPVRYPVGPGQRDS